VPAIKLDNENIGGHLTPLQEEARHPSRRRISAGKKIAAAVNAAEFVKFGQPLHKLRLTSS